MNYHVFFALMLKELLYIRSLFATKLIDCIAVMLCVSFLYGYIMPFMGIPADMRISAFLGSIILALITIHYTDAIRMAFDQHNHKFIQYQYTLPISGRWVITSYITSCILQSGLILIPILSLGILFLRNNATFSINIPATIFIIFLTLAFQALFFTWLSFESSLQWFLRNAWPRRITPLIIISSIFCIWKSVFIFSPTVACFMLLNPFTLMAEGLRGSLLGFENFVPYWYCTIMLIGYCILMLYGLSHAIYKKLDPVLL